MTEAKWLAGVDPDALLKCMAALGHSRTKGGKRRLRLFGCACCRRIWPQLDDDSRAAIEASERFADGLLPQKELARVESETLHRGWRASYETQRGRALWACHNAVRRGAPPKRASAVFHLAAGVAAGEDRHRLRKSMRTGHGAPGVKALLAEEAAQCALMRDIFGNPFRPVALDRAWLSPAVGGLAATIYEERQFDELPILADALDDAGCDNDAVLSHCRQPGEHVRGYWVVDLLLGKA
jgi:hypothetical protein